MTTTTNLEATHLAQNQNTPEVTVNGAFDVLDTALGSLFTYDVSSSSPASADYTLSTATDPEEWQNLAIKITDTTSPPLLASGINVICPTNKKAYFLINATLQTITLKTSAGTGIGVGAGKAAILYCDGTNVIRITADA